jgi:uridine kinase
MGDRGIILIVTGVSGSGKTTVAMNLAQQLGWAFKSPIGPFPRDERHYVLCEREALAGAWNSATLNTSANTNPHIG